MRYLYTLLFYLAVPFILLRLFWRSRKEPAYRQRWLERFGFTPVIPQHGCIWVHAVSLGETRAALPLIRALQERYRNTPLLITTMTPTGSQQVLDSLGDSVYHVYLPYDLPDAIQRFLLRNKPKLGIIMETELWPNLLYACARNAVPVVIANARLSERSARGYLRFPAFTARTLNCVTLIAAQSRADAARFRDLGFPAERLRVTGNIKYDLPLPLGLTERGNEFRTSVFGLRPVWIAASTHAGEDEIILNAFRLLQLEFPNLLLNLVPRHPSRFDTVADLCQQQNFHLIRRSSNIACHKSTDIFLGDSMGELLLFYAAADVAFVGGSLIPLGGHNILEPALLGLPVLSGPHMFNFAEASQLLIQQQAALQVFDAHSTARQVGRLLRDPNLRRNIGQRSKTAVEANRGALSKLFGIIENLLETDQAVQVHNPKTRRTQQVGYKTQRRPH